MQQFPIYILDDNTILFPADKSNYSHSKFWKDTVSGILAEKLGVPVRRLRNIPYCQRRGRIVGNRFYYGEKMTKKLLARIEQAVGEKLVVASDDHEKRLEYDVSKLRVLLTHIDNHVVITGI